MTDQPQDDAATTPDDGPSVMLSKGESRKALVFGTVALGAGTVATFTSGNDVGTGALLVGGVGLVIMGIQRTPLIKFGSDKIAFELGRRSGVKQVVEKAAEYPDDTARRVREVANQVDKSIPPPSPGYQWGADFESEVRKVLDTEGWTYETGSGGDKGFDFRVLDAGGHDGHPVQLLLKWFETPRVGIDWADVRGRGVAQLVTKGVSDDKMVMVVHNLTKGGIARLMPDGERLAIVSWDSPLSSISLREAIESLAQGIPWTPQ